MSDQEVKYTMSLRDLLTGKIKDADSAINHLEGSLGAAHSMASKLGIVLAGTVGIIGGFTLLKESLHEFMEADKVMAQLQAGIASTGGAAGLTFEQLKEHADNMSKSIPYAGEAIMDVQAQLLTFPAITKDTFNKATEAIFDMSARTHRGANELAIMLGKALQDPERGITAMRRVGVNFSKEQTEVVKHLVETGKAAEAQKLILQELASEYGGSAAAAGQTFAGQMTIMGEQVRQMKEELGGVVAELLVALKPALEWAIDAFGKMVHVLKDTITWMREHGDVMKTIAITIGVVAVAYGIYTIAVSASTIATAALTAAMSALNFVLAISPLGWFLIALAAVTAAVVYCYLHFGKFRAVLWGVWEFIKEFGRIAADVFIGLGKVIIGTITFSPSKIIEGGKQALSAVAETGTRLGTAFKKGFDAGMADFAKDHQADNAPKTIAKQGAAGAIGTPGKPGTADKAPKATSAKSITIHINQLVGTINNKLTTVKDGMKTMGDNVVSTLLGAVNDSQIIAGE